MANIKELIQSIESTDSSFDEKLEAINKMEETLVALRQQEEKAVQDNVDLIVEAIKVMENKVTAQLEVAKSIVPEKGDKGDKGDKGADGRQGIDGKNGQNGVDGKDGIDGKDGVSVSNAQIDFDGSLVITLSTGQEINVGEVVAPELQERIKLVTSGGAGTVLPTQTGNANKYLKTDGSALSWDALNGSDIDLSTPPTIGNTTPNTGTFTTLIGGGSSANYGQLTGGATTKAVEFKTIGSDTNVGLAILSQGTGAIDLAAGSRGVNISNGGTVTAITRTAGGSGYTSSPTIAISAPTTAGGTQATATATISTTGTPAIVSGGTGYTVGDVLSIVGGTPVGAAATMTVTAVSSGVITSASYTNFAPYTVAPTGTISVTGGTGSSATFNISFALTAAFTITNAGSGYVEQPTVSFSGGGGSGATAYATVGSGTIIKALGSSTVSSTTLASIVFQTPNTAVPAFVLRDSAGIPDTFLTVTSNTGYVNVFTQGNATGILKIGSNGSGSLYLNTNGTNETNQMRVSHTASAVNYVQVTGAATSGTPVISSQGSDTNINLRLTPKGTGTLLSATATTILDGTAIPAGGTAGSGYKFSSTANFGIFFGSGAPTLSAAQGSLYLRSDGSSTLTRLYVNTNGSTTWTNVTTAA